MKHINGRLSLLETLVFVTMVIVLIGQTISVVHIELKKSSAKFKAEYLKSLKFLQKNIVNPYSSFLEEKDISLHQQV